MQKTLLFLLFILSLCGCRNPISRNKYYPIANVMKLEGEYVNNHNEPLSLFMNSSFKESKWQSDSIDVFKFLIEKNSKHFDLSIYGQTSDGFVFIEKFKGKYDKKKHALEIKLYKKIYPYILYSGFIDEKVKIGKDSIGNLVVEYGEQNWGNVGPIFGGDANQRKLVMQPYSSVDFVSFISDKKWGIKNKENEIIIPPIYDFIRMPNKENNLIKYRQHGKWGILTTENKNIIPAQFDEVKFYKNLIEVKKENKVGLMYIDGSVLVDPVCDYIEYWNIENKNDYIIVKLNNKKGIYKDGKQFAPPIFAYIQESNDTIVNDIHVLPFLFHKDSKNDYYMDTDFNFRKQILVPVKFNLKSIIGSPAPSILLGEPISATEI